MSGLVTTRKRQVNITLSPDIISKLEEIKKFRGLSSNGTAIEECIKHTYESMTGESGEDPMTIMRTYRDSMRVLRDTLTKKTKKLMGTRDEDEKERLREEIKEINFLIKSNKESAKYDGEINDVIFDPKLRVTVAIEKEKLDIQKERNGIMRDKLVHGINMDVLRGGADFIEE